MSDKSPTISTEFLSISSPTEETIIPNLIIEELPDTYISDKIEQNIVDYEILSKSSDGYGSDDNFSSEVSFEDESQNDRKKRNAGDDLADVATTPPVISERGLIIEEVHDVESIEKEQIEIAIIEEVESYQDVSKKGSGDGPSKFKKNKKRKTNDKRNESTVG
ncbi:hypothetical protein C1645_731664 [Glomus cerebriforme]|uniref:Uncharacterized protein n=1 Tax=Glomus cerebriforme TaxID=658196 RepID=A0A397TU53_9GLOM|nr:hypothetical protein C1645_731664 [Glomus cerebriforme]